MKKITILTEMYAPEESATAYFLTKIAEGLAQKYHVSVVTGPVINYERVIVKDLKYELQNNVKIFRCVGSKFSKNNLIGRIVNLVTRSLFIFLKALTLIEKDQIVIVVTNPPILPFIALMLKFIRGGRLSVLIHDVYPDVLVATSIFSWKSLVVRCWNSLNRLLYFYADDLIVLGRDMSQLISQKLDQSTNESKIVTIPNWSDIDLDKVEPKAKNDLLQQLAIADKFIVLYAGNIGRTHGIECLLNAIEQLQDNPSIHFLVIGSGAKKAWLESQVKLKQLKNINVLSYLKSSAKEIAISACDIAIISFVPNMAGVSVPSRMYNQLAVGKPIIAVTEEWSELALVIQEEEIGWISPPNDPAALIKTIQLASINRDLCCEMGKKATRAMKNKYSCDLAIEKYIQLYN